jgi:hypothetical protein
MSKQLNLDEMLWSLKSAGSPNFDRLRATMESLGNEMAGELAALLDIECGAASAEEPEFAGTCVPFYAKRIGQPCPEAISAYDPDEWTDTEGNELRPSDGSVKSRQGNPKSSASVVA